MNNSNGKFVAGDCEGMSVTVSNSWRATKLKFAGRIVGGGTPESSNPDYWDGSVPWLTPVDLGNEGNDAIAASKRTLTEVGVKAAGLVSLPIGSIVFSTRAPIGSVGLLSCEAVTNQGCKALVPDTHQLDSRFGFYFALDSAETLRSLGLGTTFVELSTYALKNFPVSLPSTDEQRQIAAYLDEQTAKINRLMDMRRRQMALLKEQRAALIQQAVTRGLNPNAPMKDSGLPWLGEIPAHWEQTRAKFVSKIFVPQRNKPDFNEDEGYYWVTMEEMARPIIDSATYRVSDAALTISGSRILPCGAVIASCVGNFGAASINAVPVIINQQLQAFIPHRINNEFLRLLVTISAPYFEKIATAATLVYVNQVGFANLSVPLPPVDEQMGIIDFITSESKKFDTLHASYARQLTLLAEYRTSLIHECVTGQRVVGAVTAGAVAAGGDSGNGGFPPRSPRAATNAATITVTMAATGINP